MPFPTDDIFQKVTNSNFQPDLPVATESLTQQGANSLVDTNSSNVEASADPSDADLLKAQTELIDEFKSQYPQLNEYELYIAAEVNELLNRAQQMGITLTERQAIELGIERFQKKFMSAAQHQLQQADDSQPNPGTQNVQPAVQAQVNDKAISRMAINMDLNDRPVTFSKLTPDDIWNMPQSQFDELEKRMKSQYYR